MLRNACEHAWTSSLVVARNNPWTREDGPVQEPGIDCISQNTQSIEVIAFIARLCHIIFIQMHDKILGIRSKSRTILSRETLQKGHNSKITSRHRHLSKAG